MKIALIELIKEEIGEYPILLLDDVLSELDDQRKTKLLDILNNRIQNVYYNNINRWNRTSCY